MSSSSPPSGSDKKKKNKKKKTTSTTENNKNNTIGEESKQSMETPPLECSRADYEALIQQVQTELSSEEEAAAELRDCSRFGEVDAVRAILQVYPAVVNHADASTGNTALHMASANGHLSTLRLLLAEGASARLGNSSGNTALHWAVTAGHVGVVEYLLKHVADVDVLQRNEFGRSSLTEAFGRSSASSKDEDVNTQLVKLLLEHDSASEERLVQGAETTTADQEDEAETEQGKEKDDAPTKKDAFVIHDFEFHANERDDEAKSSSGSRIVRIRELPMGENPLGSSAEAPEEDSTGVAVWCASLVMARFLAQQSTPPPRLVVELGAGCGVPSLALAATLTETTATATTVYASDLNTQTLDNLQYNIELNKAQETVQIASFNWSQPPPAHLQETVDVVLGSDLIYQASVGSLLQQYVSRLLRPGGIFYYVAPSQEEKGGEGRRQGLTEFLQSLPESSFELQAVITDDYYQSHNPLQTQDDEMKYLHFHELQTTTYHIYTFVKKDTMTRTKTKEEEEEKEK